MKLSLTRILKESEQNPKDFAEEDFWEKWKNFKSLIGKLKLEIYQYQSILDKFSDSEEHVDFLSVHKIVPQLREKRKIPEKKQELKDLHQEMMIAIRANDTKKYNELSNLRTKKYAILKKEENHIYDDAQKISDNFHNLRKSIFNILNNEFSWIDYSPADLLNQYLDHVDDYDTAYEATMIVLNAISLLTANDPRMFRAISKPLQRFLDDNF